MKAIIIIGKNFGDEGKGLATDYFALNAVRGGLTVVCVRQNGGAQAGHTVDLHDARFVFSQLSSASFRGLDTYWADSFMPDLFKLAAEADSFREVSGRVPAVYASPDCRCTYIGDVLINMMLEASRGEARHGSCGMGINEAAVRSETYPLRLGDVIARGAEALYSKLAELNREYTPKRIAELGIDIGRAGEYVEMLGSGQVLRNAAEEMSRNAELVQLRETGFLADFDEIIFEGAQGLLLDELNLEYAPHLTTSRTGMYEPARILRSLFGAGSFPETEVAYVTRSYVTRHGAGPLPYEGLLDPLAYGITDRTNVHNEWQGSLRFAPHGSVGEFTGAVLHDSVECGFPARRTLFVTHLNETGGCIVTKDGSVPAERFCAAEWIGELFDGFRLSYSPYAEDVCGL
ncbi:MAG: adenylosuccinate synthetase [Ruminococcus sp.]|nr:adenylosuccinate synthetase [Ruminococcus sp.]